MHGRMHLLVTRRLSHRDVPDRYLVTFTEKTCGPIRFQKPGWKSEDIQLISASVRRDRYEVMALLGPNDWIESSIGHWTLSRDCSRLVLEDSNFGGQL